MKTYVIPEPRLHENPAVDRVLKKERDRWVGVSDLEKAARVMERCGYSMLTDPGKVWGHDDAKRIAAFLRDLDARGVS